MIEFPIRNFLVSQSVVYPNLVRLYHQIGRIFKLKCGYEQVIRNWLENVCWMMRVQYLFLTLIVFIGLTLCVWNSPVYAQDSSKNGQQHLFWVNWGIGMSSYLGALGASFSYQSGKHLFSIRYTGSGGMKLFAYYTVFLIPMVAEEPWITDSDFGVLYGRITKARYGFASVSAGIGLVRRFEEERSFTTFGIPIEGQLFFTPLPFLGIGFYPFANLNLKAPFYGVLICVQIGKLR